MTTEFTYPSTLLRTGNGEGGRVAKTVGGAETRYTLDGSTGLTTGPAAGLVQVLVETTGGQSTAYLYGHDLLAEEAAAWAWHLNDGPSASLRTGLGSVRQLYGRSTLRPDGGVTLAQGYTPFGTLLWREGETASAYGFTGEQQDATVGLVFLRARYYDPETGRFISKDPWPGVVLKPGTLHGFVYVLNNPANGVDPSGMLCIFGIGNCDEEVDLAAVAYYTLVQIDFCRGGWCWGGEPQGIGLKEIKELQDSGEFYEEMYWLWYHPAQAWGLPEDSLKTLMIEDWLFEQIPAQREYDASHPATQLLMRHKGVNDARKEFYQSGCQPMTELNGNAHEYDVKGESNREAVTNYVKAQVFLMTDILFGREDTLGTIEGTLGSYRVEIMKNRDDYATFRVWNKTGRESFTREYLKVMPSWLPEAWLKDKTCEETKPNWFSERGLGGNMLQYFVWVEPIPPGVCDGCP